MSFIKQVKDNADLAKKMGIELKYLVLNEDGFQKIWDEIKDREGIFLKDDDVFVNEYAMNNEEKLQQTIEYFNELSEEIGLEIICDVFQDAEFSFLTNIQGTLRTLIQSRIARYFMDLEEWV